MNLMNLMNLIPPHTATVSNTLVSPKYPRPNNPLTKTSPRIL